MKVRVIKKAYYDDRIRSEGSIIDFQGDKLPSWAEAVDPGAEVKEPEALEKPEPVSLHELATKPAPKVAVSAKKEVEQKVSKKQSPLKTKKDVKADDGK